MKKRAKRIISMMLAVLMILSVVTFVFPSTASAQEMRVPSRARCGVGMKNYRTIELTLPNSGCYIYGIKKSSSRLHVKQTIKDTTNGNATLSVYADKRGTYKIYFNIRSAAKKKIGSRRTITVYAAGNGGVLRQVTVGNYTTMNENLETTIYTNQTTPKISVKGLSGIRITKIEVGRYTLDGSGMEYTRIKNGKRVRLSTCGDSFYNEYYYDGTYYRREDMMAVTTIKITYIDRFDFNNEGECEIKIYKPAKEWAY